MDDRRRRFELQVLPHLDAAYRFARWLARSPHDADDVVQEAILRAYRGFDALRGSDVKAWLLTIVKNCHLTAHQQQQRRGTVPLPDEHDGQDEQALIATGADPESATISQDQERTLERLVSGLPDPYREIAAVTNVPLGTVMSRLARARAALKKQWLQQVEGEPHAVP